MAEDTLHLFDDSADMPSPKLFNKTITYPSIFSTLFRLSYKKQKQNFITQALNPDGLNIGFTQKIKIFFFLNIYMSSNY